MNQRIGYLGPRGTNAEEVLVNNLKVAEENLVPYATVSEVVFAVAQDEVDQGVVPIENSIEGSVNETLDILTFSVDGVIIQREIVVPIKHHLVARPGVEIKDISAIISHPQATAQCRSYLAQNLPQKPIIAANSTAEAVKRVAEQDGTVAAIGTELAAKIYNLKILASDIEDYRDNQTRFVLVGKEMARPTGKDKTSLVAFIYENRPGSLLQILQELAFRYINLTKIQSRPTKKALGEYCFWIDMEGHIEDEVIADALKCLRCKLRDVKVLGSYPRG